MSRTDERKETEDREREGGIKNSEKKIRKGKEIYYC